MLDVEKVGRLQALDTASSRDAFVAETLLKNEMEMEKKLADMRLMLQQEREQMLAQQAINNSIHMSIQQQQQQGNSVQSTMMNQNNNSKANTNSSSVNDLNLKYKYGKNRSERGKRSTSGNRKNYKCY